MDQRPLFPLAYDGEVAIRITQLNRLGHEMFAGQNDNASRVRTCFASRHHGPCQSGQGPIGALGIRRAALVFPQDRARMVNLARELGFDMAPDDGDAGQVRDGLQKLRAGEVVEWAIDDVIPPPTLP